MLFSFYPADFLIKVSMEHSIVQSSVPLHLIFCMIVLFEEEDDYTEWSIIRNTRWDCHLRVVAEHFWYICLLSLLESVTDGS
jgi:hypothetical protein